MMPGGGAAVRMLVRVLAGLVLIAAILFGFADPVIAKGPESVTITGPGINRPIEVLAAENIDLVSQLMGQTSLWFGTSRPPLQPEELPAELGPSYMLTWINSGPPGDSLDQRTIRQLIYLDAENGPVIHTPDQESLRGWGPEVIGWFEAPTSLRDTLAELGAPVSAAPPSGAAALSESDAGAARSEGDPARASLYLGVVVGLAFAGLAWALVGRRRSLARQR